MLRYLLFCLFIFPSTVNAEEESLEIIDSPEMPLTVQDGEPMEADVTIIRRGEKTMHEYRVNGIVYKIKVIPDIGPAYYYIDPDGDGEMEEVSESDLDRLIKINQWTFFRW